MSKYYRLKTRPILLPFTVAAAMFAANISQAQMPKQMVFATLDYSIWDAALENVVLDFGPSTRRRARRPDPVVGTKFVRGHKSAYRLEGSRVTFSYLNDAYREGLREYRKDLESIATQVDITRFPKNEQLAFWFNLHNVALVEQIADAYPIDRPSNIKVRIDGVKTPLDEAKFMTVQGMKLSLRDIREKIVYENWSDPNVIYGFFRGNVGSPKLPRISYTSNEVEDMLAENATEFVNSLRGFHEASSARKISAIYEEAQPYFFPNWNSDLTSHLLEFAEREVIAEVNSGKPFKADRYDAIIADLSAGNRLGSSGNAIRGAGTLSFDTLRLLSEVEQKQRVLKKKGIIDPNLRRGFVTIEDMEPDETLITSQSSEAPE